ncbi:hypothetical protein P5673_021789 [Acropora cervicornis]|uniref:Uncharacterized protein n=1 Tax=Acropora cervicornis TaxID=6130 RepID=A0AAD9V033_ACRCE|nr:hypothetical protein P5673_021789 [Acropora cervicornis]
MTQKRGYSLSSKYVVVCCTWKAKKPVHLLSTIPEELEIGQVERRLSKGEANISASELVYPRFPLKPASEYVLPIQMDSTEKALLSSLVVDETMINNI